MALTFPRDMISSRCWETAAFRLVRRQEISRSAAATQVRDLGPSLWSAQFETYPMRQSEAEELEADMLTLGGAVRSFHGVPMRRRRPMNFLEGLDLTGATVNEVGAQRTSLRLAGLPPSFALVAGDWISIDTGIGLELLKIARGAAADATGVTPSIEVAPQVRVSVTAGDSVRLVDPLMEMRLEPDSLEMPRVSATRWRVAFTAMQVVR